MFYIKKIANNMWINYVKHNGRSICIGYFNTYHRARMQHINLCNGYSPEGALAITPAWGRDLAFREPQYAHLAEIED